MAGFKYSVGQRVVVEHYGAGEIDALPYNAESDIYGIWLDRPEVIETSHGVVMNRWVPVPEKFMKAENN